MEHLARERDMLGIPSSPSDQRHRGPDWMRIMATKGDNSLPKGKWMELMKNSSSFTTLLRACFCGVNHRAQMERIKEGKMFMFSLFLLPMPAMINVGVCYRLDICTAPKFLCWNPKPQCNSIRRWGLLGGEDEAFGRCLDHEDTALIKGISVFVKETSREPFPYFPPGLWWHSEKMVTYEPRSELSPESESAGTLTLDFPSLPNCEKQMFVI